MRREQRAANVRRLNQSAASVEVYIDELVLRGFSPADRDPIGNALSLEMERQLTEASTHSFLRQSADLPFIQAGRIALPPNAKPAWVGTQVGRAVFSGLLNNPRGNR